MPNYVETAHASPSSRYFLIKSSMTAVMLSPLSAVFALNLRHKSALTKIDVRYFSIPISLNRKIEKVKSRDVAVGSLAAGQLK